jgi:hypothetical protein
MKTHTGITPVYTGSLDDILKPIIELSMQLKFKNGLVHDNQLNINSI